MVDAAARVPPQRPCGPGPGGGPSLAAPVEWWPQRGVELSAEKYLNWSGKILYRASRCEQWHSSSRDQQHAVPAGAPGARHPGQPGPGHQVAVSKFIHFFQIEFRYVRYMLDVCATFADVWFSFYPSASQSSIDLIHFLYISSKQTTHFFISFFNNLFMVWKRILNSSPKTIYTCNLRSKVTGHSKHSSRIAPPPAPAFKFQTITTIHYFCSRMSALHIILYFF